MARLVCLLAVGLCLVIGCGKDTGGRLPVSGTIKLKGQPIENGTINFTSKDPSLGVATGAPITNGEYTIPAESGLLPGVYIVRISAAQGAPAPAEAAPPGEPPPPVPDLVPPQYNSSSTLEFEVKPETDNRFDLDIP